MIKISSKDWDKFKRDNDPEVFAKSFIDALIEANKELLEKAESAVELTDEEKVYVDNFRTELSHFTPVEIMSENPDKLQKSLKHDIYFIREKQVDWDETIEKSEDGEDYSFGTFRNTPLNNKLGRVGSLIEKGKRGQVGEIREWKGGKYKKTAQGWIPVSEGKKESGGEKKDSDDRVGNFKIGDSVRVNDDKDIPISLEGLSGKVVGSKEGTLSVPKFAIIETSDGKRKSVNPNYLVKKDSDENKNKSRNLWIADRADELAKDHPDKSNDQLLRMAGKEWSNLETPDVNPAGESFGEPSKRPESEKVISAKEIAKLFNNIEDWGDLGDRVSVDGDKLEIADSYFYNGKDRLNQLKNDWTGSDGWMSKYLKKEYGIKLVVDSEDLQDKASGKYKKFGKNMGAAILKLKIEKA